MFKRPQYILLVLATLLTLAALNLPQRAASQVKLAISSLFLPLFGLAKTGQQGTRKAAEAIVPRSELLRQIEDLRRTNQMLTIQAFQTKSALLENQRLAQMLGWRKGHYTNLNLRAASIIARDPANWWLTAQIDVGSADGVRPNLPVVSSEGLVGRIASVGTSTSQVVLLGNPNCRVAAMVETNRAAGIIIGAAGPFENSMVTLSYVSSLANIHPGQMVTTSGDGGIFPKGLPIGQIADAPEQVDFGLYGESRVKLAVNIATLQEVWVVIP